MPDKNASSPAAEFTPKFRINKQVFQILALVGVALALPITILVLGLIGIRQNQQSTAPNPSIEASGLRETLESIANNNLQSGQLESPIRIFRLNDDKSDVAAQKRQKLLELFKGNNIPIVESAPNTWIVTVRADLSESVDKQLIDHGFLPDRLRPITSKTDLNHFNPQTILYRIEIIIGS